jgi:hypothetical protein
MGGGTTVASQSASTQKPNNSDECKDKRAPGRAPDCFPMRAYCENAIYRDLMAQQCP